MQENRGRERDGENGFAGALRQLFFRTGWASRAIHFPRRLIAVEAKPFRRRAARTTGCCECRTPDKTRQPLSLSRLLQPGNAVIRISLYKFALIRSKRPAGFCRSTSPTRKSMFRAELTRAFLRAVARARASLSIAIIRPAPSRAPAIARMPLPVPA